MNKIKVFVYSITIAVSVFFYQVALDNYKINAFNGVGGYQEYRSQRIAILKNIKNKINTKNKESEIDSIDQQIADIDNAQIEELGQELFVKSITP